MPSCRNNLVIGAVLLPSCRLWCCPHGGISSHPVHYFARLFPSCCCVIVSRGKYLSPMLSTQCVQNLVHKDVEGHGDKLCTALRVPTACCTNVLPTHNKPTTPPVFPRPFSHTLGTAFLLLKSEKPGLSPASTEPITMTITYLYIDID